MTAADRVSDRGGAAPARAVRALERALDRPGGQDANPSRQLGAIGYLLYWTLAATGALLFAFYDTSADGAWRSIDAMVRERPWGTGLARSVHRYAADGFVAVMALHLLREAALGRFRGFRWFTWVSGVPLLWLAPACAIVGLWLVWDALGGWVAASTLEWASALPVVGAGAVRNAVVAGNLSDRTFSLLMFGHIGVALLVLLAMWVHVHRLATPQTRPDRRVAAGLLLALLGLAWARPVPLHPPADPASAGGPLSFDWLLLPALPAGVAAPVATWATLAAATALLLALPWTVRSARSPVARVDTARCNGCGRCFDDCPYDAVTMVARRDGRAFAVQASVEPDLCASCGICAGACPSASPFRSVVRLDSGIDLPDRSVDDLRRRTDAALAAADVPQVLVYACEHGADARSMAIPGAVVLPLSCAGQLPPAFVDYASRRGAGAILVAGCSARGCEFRLGARWTDERLAGLREPRLRAAARSAGLLQVRADRGEERVLRARVRGLVEAVGTRRAAPLARGSGGVPGAAGRGGDDG